MAKENIQKELMFQDDDNEGPKTLEELPAKQRTAGYNKVHAKAFRKISEGGMYKWFFIVLNLYIAFKPIFFLHGDMGGNISWDYFYINGYSTVELLTLVALSDNLLTLIFLGKKHFKQCYHIVEVISTVAIQIIASLITTTITRENAKNMEPTIPFFYLLFSTLCLIRICRFMQLVIVRMETIRFVIYGVSDMLPLFKYPFLMLVVISFVFAQIGVHAFGGQINSNTPDVYANVGGGADGPNYEKLNFNDYFNAIIYLWSLIINNCWPT